MALPAEMGGGQGECRRLSCSSKINAKLLTPAGQALDNGAFRRNMVQIVRKELSVPSRTKGKYEALFHRGGEWMVRNLRGAPES